MICAENKHFIPITSVHDELKLTASSNTLGYIEFDVLYNLNNLKEKLSFSADLSCLSRNNFHVVGRYNYNGDYTIHRVYIHLNMKSLFAGQQYDQPEGCTNANHIMSSFSCSSLFVLKQQDKFKEGEQC